MPALSASRASEPALGITTVAPTYAPDPLDDPLKNDAFALSVYRPGVRNTASGPNESMPMPMCRSGPLSEKSAAKELNVIMAVVGSSTSNATKKLLEPYPVC